MNDNEKKLIGDAISLILQQRYVWIFQHIARAKFLDLLDKKPLDVNVDKYYFSSEDYKRGVEPVRVKNIILLMAKGCPKFAWSENGEIYDWNYTRKITIDGIRASIIVMIQAFLEQNQIIRIFETYKFDGVETLHFLRIARNIICHSKKSQMTRAEKCQWRDIEIVQSDNSLKMSDQKILLLIDDIVKILVNVCLTQEISIDFVSLNIGNDVPAIQNYLKLKKLKK